MEKAFIITVDSGGNYSGEAIKYIEEKTNTKLTITAVIGGANGVDLEKYAFGSVGAIGRYFDHIFGAYGVLPNYWMLKDGKVVSGSIQPEAKEALKFLNKMYANKLIDPEFVTDTIDRNRTIFKNGVYGAQANFIWMFDANNVFDYYKPFKDKNPNGEWVEGPVLQARGVNKTAITTSEPIMS